MLYQEWRKRAYTVVFLADHHNLVCRSLHLPRDLVAPTTRPVHAEVILATEHLSWQAFVETSWIVVRKRRGWHLWWHPNRTSPGKPRRTSFRRWPTVGQELTSHGCVVEPDKQGLLCECMLRYLWRVGSGTCGEWGSSGKWPALNRLQGGTYPA